MHTLTEAALRLAPLIAARAPDVEAARRLPADLAGLLAEAGLFRMLLPSDYSGFEAAPADMIATLEAIGRADGAVGWCVMIAATTSINAAYLPDHHARAIWSDPLMITGGVFAPRGKAVREGDAYRVTGRWPWGSGSANCGWLVGGALVMEGDRPAKLASGAPDARMMWFPREDAELIDTWRVMGMRGTGSGDIAVSDIAVPVDRSVSLMADRPRIDRPLYAFPAFGLLALGIASVALGVARGAVEDLVDLAVRKVPTGARRVLAERAHTQIEMARAEASLRGARAQMMDMAHVAFAKAEKAGELSLQDRAGLRLAACHAVRVSAQVTATMHELGGGTAVYDESPLQRRFRDAHVATQHVMVGAAAEELAGRALLGLEADYSQL